MWTVLPIGLILSVFSGCVLWHGSCIILGMTRSGYIANYVAARFVFDGIRGVARNWRDSHNAEQAAAEQAAHQRQSFFLSRLTAAETDAYHRINNAVNEVEARYRSGEIENPRLLELEVKESKGAYVPLVVFALFTLGLALLFLPFAIDRTAKLEERRKLAQRKSEECFAQYAGSAVNHFEAIELKAARYA